MISKKLQFGLPAIVLVFALTLVGCDDKPKGGKSPNTPSNPSTEKSIRITGISGKSGYAQIQLFSNFNNDPIAAGRATVSGSSVTIPLIKGPAFNSPWTGSGSYYIWFLFENDYDNNDLSWVYTNGQTLPSLGITGTFQLHGVQAKLPKYSVSSETSSIALTQFVELIDVDQ
jgi:hypothetical protein